MVYKKSNNNFLKFLMFGVKSGNQKEILYLHYI